MAGLIKTFRGVTPKIHESAFIADDAVIIGDVEIGPESSVWYGCVIRGDVNSIRIGARTNIQDGTVIHCNQDRTGDYRDMIDAFTAQHPVLVSKFDRSMHLANSLALELAGARGRARPGSGSSAAS